MNAWDRWCSRQIVRLSEFATDTNRSDSGRDKAARLIPRVQHVLFTIRGVKVSDE